MSPGSNHGTILWKFNCQESLRSRIHTGFPIRSISDISNAFDSTGKTWNIHISGGEPLQFPNFIEICFMLSRSHFIALDTRLSSPNAKLFAEHISPDRIKTIRAVFHSRLVKQPGELKQFTDTVKYLLDRKFNIHIEYLMYPPMVHRVIRDLILFDSQGISKVNLKVFRGKFQNRPYPASYSIETRNLLRRYSEDTREIDFLGRKRHFLGKRCSAGMNYFRMDRDGNLRRCMNSKVSYGNLFDRTYSIDSEPRPCPFSQCLCLSEGLRCASENICCDRSLIKEIAREYMYRFITYCSAIAELNRAPRNGALI